MCRSCVAADEEELLSVVELLAVTTEQKSVHSFADTPNLPIPPQVITNTRSRQTLDV